MIILCVADVFARPGREALKALVPRLIAAHRADFVIVNWENASGGRGVTPKVADELLALPVDVFTSGNHIWQHKSLAPYLDRARCLRPHNAPAGRPGRGVGSYRARNGVAVGVINLQGRVYMHEEKESANPFHVARAAVEDLRQETPVICLDFHAEATSEKRAMGWWLDGAVSAVVGTHTHVQTADEQILPMGTAYITDLGMTGPHDSVVGMRSADAIARFRTDGRERRWEAAAAGVRLEGAVLDLDETTGRARRITRLRESCSAI